MFRKWARWILKDRDDCDDMQSPVSIKGASGPSFGLGDVVQGFTFTLYNAIGGKVIQVNTFDNHTGKPRGALYVITDKEELGDEISQIIIRESLSR